MSRNSAVKTPMPMRLHFRAFWAASMASAYKPMLYFFSASRHLINPIMGKGSRIIVPKHKNAEIAVNIMWPMGRGGIGGTW